MNHHALNGSGAQVEAQVKAQLAQQPAGRFGIAREFVRLWLLARHGWSRGARPWLGLALALCAVLMSALLHYHALRPELWRSGDVYAALPLTAELERLPMSLLFPTAYLPLWAACAQLIVVIGLGELIFGRWLTVIVATVAHVGSTLVARVLLLSVHGHVFGLTPALARALDTGPSAATTAVGACLLVAARMNRAAALLCIGLVSAALIAPGVDGVEHTAALVWGLLAGTCYLTVTTRSRAPARAWRWRTRAVGVARAFRSPKSPLAGMREND